MDISMEILSQFIRPELLVLIPVLYLFGKILKDTTIIKDKYIPAALGITAIVLAIIHVFAVTQIASYRDALTALFLAITQGVLCAGAAVYVNQIFVQLGRKE